MVLHNSASLQLGPKNVLCIGWYAQNTLHVTQEECMYVEFRSPVEYQFRNCNYREL